MRLCAALAVSWADFLHRLAVKDRRFASGIAEDFKAPLEVCCLTDEILMLALAVTHFRSLARLARTQRIIAVRAASHDLPFSTASRAASHFISGPAGSGS